MPFRSSFTNRQFLRQLNNLIRVMAPTLIALSLTTVAHAQGAMDFSGAQTLMGTFNVRTSAIELMVVIPQLIQFIAKHSVRPVQGQRKEFRNFQ